MDEYIKNKIKNYYKKKKHIDIIDKIYEKKENNNIIYRIIKNLNNRACFCLNKNNIERNHEYIDLIGCKAEELKEHLEKQLTDNMTFENYGKWEIDHIKPISLFNLNNENELFECFNYKNLQPLWKIDNIKKSNKLI
jgi:hypothetical protein